MLLFIFVFYLLFILFSHGATVKKPNFYCGSTNINVGQCILTVPFSCFIMYVFRPALVSADSNEECNWNKIGLITCKADIVGNVLWTAWHGSDPGQIGCCVHTLQNSQWGQAEAGRVEIPVSMVVAVRWGVSAYPQVNVTRILGSNESYGKLLHLQSVIQDELFKHSRAGQYICLYYIDIDGVFLLVLLLRIFFWTVSLWCYLWRHQKSTLTYRHNFNIEVFAPNKSPNGSALKQIHKVTSSEKERQAPGEAAPLGASL